MNDTSTKLGTLRYQLYYSETNKYKYNNSYVYINVIESCWGNEINAELKACICGLLTSDSFLVFSASLDSFLHHIYYTKYGIIYIKEDLIRLTAHQN